jgi:hypothetical protein
MSDTRAYYARAYSRPKVTVHSMKVFSADCLKWAADAKDASARQTIVRTAHAWSRVASELERRVANGDQLVSDLRSKLD